MVSLITRAGLQYIQKNIVRNAHSASATAGGHQGGYKMWQKLFFFVGIPSVCLGMVNAYLGHQEGDHSPPEFKPYEHLRVRTKRFPWGDGTRSLFHNPHVNPLPTGYEH